MARLRRLSRSRIVLGGEALRRLAVKGQKLLSCRRGKALKIPGTGATACHFASASPSVTRTIRPRARLEYFQIEDGHREREIGPDAYSEIVRARRNVLEDHRHAENILTLIHCAPVALHPTAAFLQKTLKLSR